MDFRVLLEKITPILKSIARRHLLRGFRDEEDLYQEMCLFLWQNYSEGLPIGINESYIIKACEFHMLNYLRKGRRPVSMISMDAAITEEGQTLKDIIESPGNMFMQDPSNALTLDDIRNKGLTKKELDVLSFLIKGYTVREIADKLGISHVMVIKYKKNIIKKAKIGGYQ